MYATTGALNYAQSMAPRARHLTTPDLIVSRPAWWPVFATKAGLVPFHGWLADVHTATSGPVSALFSGLMYAFGIVAIARLAFQVFGVTHIPILGLLTVGIISALLGAIMALAQDDLKRLLAYDTISQMGIRLSAWAPAPHPGSLKAVYHLVNYALFKALLFLCAGRSCTAPG